MRQGFYRFLFSIFAAWAALSVPTMLMPGAMALRSAEPLHAQYFLLPIGFALLPVSLIGLWNLRLWGFIALVAGFILVMATYPGTIFLHALCIVLTIIRFCSAKRQAGLVT